VLLLGKISDWRHGVRLIMSLVCFFLIFLMPLVWVSAEDTAQFSVHAPSTSETVSRTPPSGYEEHLKAYLTPLETARIHTLSTT